MKFKIINGRVFDPSQKINGKKKDIYIDDGRIVNPDKSDLFYKFNISYDVEGMIVMAGAIDIHSHIAGGNVNNARLLSPEVHSSFVKKNLNRKNLPGFNSRWTAEGTGYRYAEMGFTTVVEPAVLPVNSFLTHLELEKIPMIDKAGLAILGNDSFLLESMQKKRSKLLK